MNLVLMCHVGEEEISCSFPSTSNMLPGIDKESEYLATIREAYPSGSNLSLSLEQRDVIKERLHNIANYDLICNIHFYNAQLLKNCISDMKAGAFLLVETPSCFGGNYRDLPTENELKELLRPHTIIEFHFKKCNHYGNTAGTGSAKLLIRKT